MSDREDGGEKTDECGNFIEGVNESKEKEEMEREGSAKRIARVKYSLTK